MAVGRELRLVAVMGVMTKWPIRADAEPSIAAHRRSCFISSVDGDGYKVGKGSAAQANWRRTVATNGRAGRLHIRYTIDGSWPDPTDGAKTSERRYRLFGTGMSPGLAHHPVGLLRSATSRCLLTQAGSHSSYGGPGQKVALETSLVSLYTHYNERFRDPVWIFHEGDFTEADQARITKGRNETAFKLLPPTFYDLPLGLNASDAVRGNWKGAARFSVGYRCMIQWCAAHACAPLLASAAACPL